LVKLSAYVIAIYIGPYQTSIGRLKNHNKLLMAQAKKQQQNQHKLFHKSEL